MTTDPEEKPDPLAKATYPDGSLRMSRAVWASFESIKALGDQDTDSQSDERNQ